MAIKCLKVRDEWWNHKWRTFLKNNLKLVFAWEILADSENNLRFKQTFIQWGFNGIQDDADAAVKWLHFFLPPLLMKTFLLLLVFVSGSDEFVIVACSFLIPETLKILEKARMAVFIRKHLLFRVLFK